MRFAVNMTASSNAGQSKAGQSKAEHIARFGTYGAWGWFKQFSPDEAREIAKDRRPGQLINKVKIVRERI